MERALRAGETFAGYRVARVLHEGGMGWLYSVTRPGETRPLVLKTPRLAFASHAACLVGFEQEAMILARLTGAHVPRLVASGEAADGSPYLVTEEVPGPSLAELARAAPLAPARIVELALPLAAALHELHRQDVVHLDLKPAHVRYRPEGTAVLLDFGLARHGHLPDLVGEEFDRPLGTAAYLSPEQVLGVRGDPRSDLFAFGVILYALATGQLPFGEPDSRSALRRRLHQEAAPPRSLVPGLPQWFQEMVLRCLEIDPDARYATAARLAHELAHPEQVVITDRGRRLEPAGPLVRMERRWRALKARREDFPTPAEHLARAPHVLIALDMDAEPALNEALREAAAQVAASRPECLLACVAVCEPDAGEQADEDDALAQRQLTERRVWLRHWARALALPPERLRVHVLRGTDPAPAILDYARRLHADQIIVGARASGALRRMLGSVSSSVVAQAPCSVTVVRTRPPAH